MSRLQQLIDAIPDEPSRVPYGNGTLALRTTIAALRRKVDRREDIIRAYHEMLKTAAEELPSVAYENEDDEIGSRTCCGVISYEQHHGTCVVPMMQELVARFEKEFGDGK